MDHFYNLTFSPTDRQDPAYRGVLVATRTPQPAALAEIAATYPPVPADGVANLQRMELTNMLLRLLDLKVANHDDRGLREQLEAREQNLTALQGHVGLLERDLLSTQAHAEQLHELASKRSARRRRRRGRAGPGAGAARPCSTMSSSAKTSISSIWSACCRASRPGASSS